MKEIMSKRKFCGGLHVIHSDNFFLLLIYVDLLIPLVDYVVSRDCCVLSSAFSFYFTLEWEPVRGRALRGGG